MVRRRARSRESLRQEPRLSQWMVPPRPPVLRVVATLSLALVLFTDAVSLSIPEVKRNSGLNQRWRCAGCIERARQRKALGQ